MLYPAELRDRPDFLIAKVAVDEGGMTKAAASVLMLLTLAACGANAPMPGLEAGERGRVVRVVDGDVLMLNGGQTVRLASLEAPRLARRDAEAEPHAESARDMLETLSLGRDVQLYYPGLTRDRYDRAIAHVLTRDGRGPPVWLNQVLLRQGAARVRLYPDTDAGADALFAAETEARLARRGLWALSVYQPKPVAALDPAGARFGLVHMSFGPVLPDAAGSDDRDACVRAVSGTDMVVRVSRAAAAVCEAPADAVYEVRGRVRGGELLLTHPRHAVPLREP